MVGAAQNIYTNNAVGVSDALAFAPILGYTVQRLRGISNQCFLEDTAVLAGTADGEMVSRNIQDIQVGDLVWTRSSDNPDAPLELREVTAVYRNVTYSVQRLTVEDELGNVNQISVTPGHEFYSASRNAWIRVADLVEGEWLVSADGRSIQVVTNVAEACPEGLVTYNMEVANGHTYFVADGLGQESWTWVHNSCIADSVRIGYLGEKEAGTLGKKVRAYVPDSTTYRVPDKITKTALTEVKNVKKLRWTAQLEDYVKIAEARNLSIVLWIRESHRDKIPVSFMKSLQDSIRGGNVTVTFEYLKGLVK